MALATAVAAAMGIVFVTGGAAGAASSVEAPASSAAQSAKKAVATLTIIEPSASVQRKGNDEFKPATDGQRLRVGDTVQTDATGFAQINYTEDSFTRLDVNTTFTIVSLSDDEGNRKIKGSLDTGRTWNRTSALTESESFEQEGAGATAAVVGSAYLVTCVSANNCVFISVHDGLRITTVDGDVQFLDQLEACDSSEVTDTDADLCSVPTQVQLEVLLADAFFAINYFLDASLGLPLPALTGTVEIDEFGNVTFTPTAPPADTPPAEDPGEQPPVIDPDNPILIENVVVAADVVLIDGFAPADQIFLEDEDPHVVFKVNVTSNPSGLPYFVVFTVLPDAVGPVHAPCGSVRTGAEPCSSEHVVLTGVQYLADTAFHFHPDQFEPSYEYETPDGFPEGTDHNGPATTLLPGGNPSHTADMVFHVETDTTPPSPDATVPVTVWEDVCGDGHSVPVCGDD